MWTPGDRVIHRFNPDLGPGLVVAVEHQRVTVLFPETGETLQIAARSDVLEPLVLTQGGRARHDETGEVIEVGRIENGICYLGDGRELPVERLWPLPTDDALSEYLARGKVGSLEDWRNRLDGLRLLQLRQADGLGSFLGGRIQLYPHQLYAAEQATRGEAGDTVRWLLADEVGLGKTVEACLIMNRLLHTGRAERTLVVVPETLTVQWLGELWRKYHQVFVLLDDKRLKDVGREYGDGFNPFEVYRRTIISLERLSDNRQLVEQAVEIGIDLLVVDEAHHLRRPAGHPGNAAYRAIEPLAALDRNLLLLSATPLEDDAHGFFRLLQLLRPEELPEEESFDERLAERRPLPPCTSATRRQDIGGLPPREAHPVEIEDDGWAQLEKLTAWARSLPASNALEVERKAERILRAQASPAALEPVLGKNELDSEQIETAKAADPRVRWLAEQASGWRQRQEKTLIFVAHRETLDHLRSEIERLGRIRVGIFHEDLAAERRDVEVAQFRLFDGPAVLISTECGGEGRNFEFCKRLVLFDLPWNPAVVEQRIGRLDRIGRDRPTEVVYFRPPTGLRRILADLYEAIGLFQEPLGGLERELGHVAREVRRVATEGNEEVDASIFDEVLDEARKGRDRVREAALHELHRNRYSGDLATQILARVPANLDELTEDVVMRAAARFGFGCEEQTGPRNWLIEYGSESLVDHLPGVADGSRFLGTFDRAEAVNNESLDFFANGHPLVEGILDELEEGKRGKVALLQIPGTEEIFGLLAIYRNGPDFEAVAIDSSGTRRDDLAEMLIDPRAAFEPVSARQWTSQRSWVRGIRKLTGSLPPGEPSSLAAFRVRRQ